MLAVNQNTGEKRMIKYILLLVLCAFPVYNLNAEGTSATASTPNNPASANQDSDFSIDEGGGEEGGLQQNEAGSKKAKTKEVKDSANGAMNDTANEVFNLLEDMTSKTIEHKKAKIIALNKITAKSQEMILNVGEAKYFGNIEIKLQKCLKIPNPYKPDNKILLTVIENKTDEDPTVIFQGWMMSSNISISTFEHPVYEIFAKDCL